MTTRIPAAVITGIRILGAGVFRIWTSYGTPCDVGLMSGLRESTRDGSDTLHRSLLEGLPRRTGAA